MAKQQKKAEVYVANESFHTEGPGGVPVSATRGQTRVRAGHWLLKAHPQFFDPIDEHIDYDVEQATAGPGERRAVNLTTGGN